MNKKGFTLVELLAVIVILAIIITIAVPSTIAVSNKIKKKMYNTKVDMIMDAAKMYGQDNSSKVNSDEDSCNTLVKVSDLLPGGYVKKDDVDNGKVLSPIDNSAMNDLQLCLYKKNNRIYAKPNNCNEWTNNNNIDLNNYCK